MDEQICSGCLEFVAKKKNPVQSQPRSKKEKREYFPNKKWLLTNQNFALYQTFFHSRKIIIFIFICVQHSK